MTVSDTVHPAEHYARDLAIVRSRAKWVMIFLGLTAAQRVFAIAVTHWQNTLGEAIQRGEPPSAATLSTSDTLLQAAALLQIGLLAVTATLFLMWIHRVVKVTRVLGGSALRWSPRDAVWGFILPLINITRPFHVLRDVHDHLAPDALPEPTVQLAPSELMGYRGVTVVAPPTPGAVPHASIGAWWGTFWIGNAIGNFAARQNDSGLEALLLRNHFNMASDVFDLVAAVLAMTVVHGVSARLFERYRRARYNAPEVLAAAGISIAAPTN